MKIKQSKLMGFIVFALDDIERTDFWGICAQMSFYILMSFFPLLVFLINFIGRFISQFKTYLFDLLQKYLPQLSYDYVRHLTETLMEYAGQNSYFLIILTFFFASLAARAIMIGMNQNYGNTETRSRLKIWLLSFLFTLLFAITLIFVVIAYIFSQSVNANLLSYFAINDSYLLLTAIFSFIFSLIVSIIIFDLIYTLAPDRRLAFKQGLPGAIFSALGFNIAFRVFLVFMNHSSKYTMLYGGFGGFFALLVVIYFICVILNFGGKINVFFCR